MKSFIQRLWNDEAGTATLEYAFVLGLIILASMGLIGAFGTKVVAHWTSINSSFH